MRALIKTTEKISSNLQKEENNSNMELVNLLKQKIEYSIIENRKIVIDISNPLISCRNTFSAEDYEINDEYLYLNHGSFELHIKLDKIEKIKYDVFIYENFVFLYNDMHIILQFLE